MCTDVSSLFAPAQRLAANYSDVISAESGWSDDRRLWDESTTAHEGVTPIRRALSATDFEVL